MINHKNFKMFNNITFFITIMSSFWSMNQITKLSQNKFKKSTKY